jgi:hypothetical protein
LKGIGKKIIGGPWEHAFYSVKYKKDLISMAKGLHDCGRSSFPLMKTSSMWGGDFKYKGI